MSDGLLTALGGEAQPLASSPMHRTTRSTCCYCGVGCGVLIHSTHDDAGERIVGIEGDPLHPANHGRLCSKGLALPQTAASQQGRLLAPELRRHRDAPRTAVSWDQALSHVTLSLIHI